jgi:hypothetical protein
MYRVDFPLPITVKLFVFSNLFFISIIMQDLMSKAGYCFINLRSALEFINNVDACQLSIDPTLFKELLEAREATIHSEDIIEASRGGIFS